MIFFRNFFLLLMILSMIAIPALTASVSAQTSGEKKETEKNAGKKWQSEAWIDVRATKIEKLKDAPVWHLLIVYHGTDDKTYFYRGGPDKSKTPLIIGTSGLYKPKSVDYDITSPSKRVMTGKDAENKNLCFQKELDKITKSKIVYDAFGLNSNSVAYTLLVNCNVPAEKPVFIAKSWGTKLKTDESIQTPEKSKVLKDVISEQKDKKTDNKDTKNKQKKTDNKNTVKSDPNNKSTQDNKKVLQQLRVKTTSISNYPKDSIINNFLAEADSFLKQGKYQDAIFYYEQVIRSDPKNSGILNNLAMVYYNLGDYEKALGYYNAIESNSNNKTTQDDKEAIQAKTTSPTNEQKNKEVKDLLDKAWALRDEGKCQEAIKIYEQILDIDPKNFSALWRLGACYLQLGDYENAREYYDDALNINHEDTYVLTMLGYIYEKLGNYDKAMKYYNTSITIDPNYKYAQDLKKALEQKIKTPENTVPQSGEGSLSSTLAEAGDISGTYSGYFNGAISSPYFQPLRYSGTFELELHKTGDNTYSGSLTRWTSDANVAGQKQFNTPISISITVSSSAFSGSLIDGTTVNKGAFTSLIIGFHTYLPDKYGQFDEEIRGTKQ